MQLLKRLYVNCLASEWYESHGLVFLRESAAKKEASRWSNGQYSIWRWAGIGLYYEITMRIVRDDD